MQFLTTEYVAEQAKDEISALECSWEHHHQGETAPKLELINTIKDGTFHPHSPDECACCQKYGCCNSPCPLRVIGERYHCCGGLHNGVSVAWSVFGKDYSNANFKAFQEAEGEICTYISGVLERKRAEQKDRRNCPDCKHCLKGEASPCGNCLGYGNFEPKESKPALRHGDYGNGHLYLEVASWLKGDGNLPNRMIAVKDGILHNISPDDKIETKLGNIFDDLARNAEDLEEFEIAPQKGDSGKMVVSIDDGGDFWFDFGNGRCRGFDRTVKFHQKLGQMLAFARRKQAQKGAKE